LATGWRSVIAWKETSLCQRTPLERRQGRMSDLDDLKKEVFYRLMDLAGKVYVVARNSEDVVIGERGFVGDEKEQGVTLVFNQRMKFIWDDVGIKATLVFGSSAEKCEVPASEMIAIFSPELNVQFVAGPAVPDEKAPEGPVVERVEGEDGKVIKVDFKKKED
jgi:hypothetical protein